MTFLSMFLVLLILGVIFWGHAWEQQRMKVQQEAARAEQMKMTQEFMRLRQKESSR